MLVWELFVRIWEEEQVPMTFKLSRIRALYKNKEDRSDCNSFRGISLLSVPGKIFARVLLNHLRILSENIYRKHSLVPDQTGGFAKQSSQFGSCRRKAEQYRHLYLCFPRAAFWMVLKKLGCTEKFLRLVSYMMPRNVVWLWKTTSHRSFLLPVE